MMTKEIAQGIDAHLTRFEKDKGINALNAKYGTTPYYMAGAWAAGRWVHVRYVSYQYTHTLTKAEAEAYLLWLNAGHVGRHSQVTHG